MGGGVGRGVGMVRGVEVVGLHVASGVVVG